LLLCDVLGLVLVAWITTAGVQDRDAAAAVLPMAAEQFPTLKKAMRCRSRNGTVLSRQSPQEKKSK
jgi:putative transposase